MINKISISPRYNLISKQLNLSNFNFKKPKNYYLNKNIENKNNLLKFIKNTFNYAKISLNKYSNNFSKHLYTQHALFIILAIKIYTKSTYREIIDFLENI